MSPRKAPTCYTPGAGGALTGIESALSSLPSCPRDQAAAKGCGMRRVPDLHEPICGAPSRPHSGRLLRCTAGHVFAGTAAEHEQARGALAAADRRAPHTQAERATARERTAERKGGAR